MSNNREYILLSKDLLEGCLKEFAKELKKRIKDKNVRCELILVGGASIVLNYGFRLTTSDIDCTDKSKILMNDVISLIADRYNLPSNWINTDFTNSKSYSIHLDKYSTFFKSYGNGLLEIRTIKDEYLLAMKVVSARKYKNDYSDIYGILTYCYKNNKPISIDALNEALVNLYGDINYSNKEAYDFAIKIISNPEIQIYDDIKKKEESNANIVKTKVAEKAEKADIEYLLSKLDLMDD